MSVEIHIMAAYHPVLQKFRVECNAKGHNHIHFFSVEEFLGVIRTRKFPWGIKIMGGRGSAEAKRIWEYLGSVAASYKHTAAVLEKLPIRFTRQDFLKAYVEAYVDENKVPGFTVEDYITEAGESEAAVNRMLITLREFGWVTGDVAGNWTKVEKE